MKSKAELDKRMDLEQKLIDLENKCERMGCELRMNTARRVPDFTESTRIKSTAFIGAFNHLWSRKKAVKCLHDYNDEHSLVDVEDPPPLLISKSQS